MKSVNLNTSSVMNTRMWFRSLALATGLVTAINLIPLALPTQAAPAAPAAKEPPPRPAYALEIRDGALLHPGPGGPANLANVVDALRDLFPDCNFVLAPELANVLVMDLKLRPGNNEVEVNGHLVWPPQSIGETLTALRVAAGNRFLWRNGVAESPPPQATPQLDPATGLPAAAPPQEASSLFTLLPDPTAAQSRRAVEAFSLQDYLQSLPKQDEASLNQSLGDIENLIVETLNSMDAEVARPQIRFHPGTKLLVVIGSPEAIDVAAKIITALPGYHARSGGGGFGASSPANPPAPTPAQTAAENAFRRRYGLNPYVPAPALPQPSRPVSPQAPAPQPPGQPSNPPDVPAPATPPNTPTAPR